MKELELTLEEMKKGTEQEQTAAQIVEKMTHKEIEEGHIQYGFEDGVLMLGVNPKTFSEGTDKDRMTKVVYIAEAIKGGFYKRGVGLDHAAWNMAMALELATVYANMVKDQVKPMDLGFEDGLSAEEYYLLVQEFKTRDNKNNITIEDGVKNVLDEERFTAEREICA